MNLPLTRSPFWLCPLVVAAATCWAPAVLLAAGLPVPSNQVEFFESKVRPVLAGTCQKCHSAATHKGGLRLDSRESALKGGDSGAAVVPGNPTASPMIDAINYRGLEMPPTGKLKPREIEALVEWVKMGAPWPKDGPKEQATAGPSRGDFTITQEDRRYWAFQPIGHPQPPTVRKKDWPANPIDAFILARLEERGLTPNPPAEPRVLIRRAYFDVIGLPPTPEEVDAFVANPSEQAYGRLIDKLLSRKEYGERWGRHWLDVARFAQTNGYERDAEKPEAWRYRDYVINAFNADKPYDRFITEQLAGDEFDEPTTESITATGFYRLGIWDDEPDNQAAAAWDEIDEMVRTTSAAFLGLTMGCARCHNHMFDPIPQEDYYRMAAFFRNVEPYGKALSATHLGTNEDGIFTPVGSEAEVAAWKVGRADLSRQMKATREKLDKLPKKDANRAARRPLVEELARLKKLRESIPLDKALSVRECGPPLRETHVLIRGNVAAPGKRVEPRFLAILGGKTPAAVPVSFTGSAAGNSLKPMLAEFGLRPTMGLRRELAKWIADKDNPLTARVMVNRVWQEYFGRGIVRSTDNFGRAGTPPTHPELLSWLARDFVDGGWHIKRMHKRILLSQAYRMSSAAANSQARATDADNDLFWRQNLRRLDAEAIRDSMLAVSGRLNPAGGGRGIFPPLSRDVLATQSRPGLGWGASSLEEQSRRSVYIYLKRTLMVPFFETFDYTNTAESVGTRPVTTVAPQALLLLNSEFTDLQARNLAERVRHEAGDGTSRQIKRLFRLALGRLPTPHEAKLAGDLLKRSSTPDQKADPLRSLCLVVLNLNEFVYLD
jgi:mono/diheme cytochrome c family protein